MQAKLYFHFINAHHGHNVPQIVITMRGVGDGVTGAMSIPHDDPRAVAELKDTLEDALLQVMKFQDECVVPYVQ